MIRFEAFLTTCRAVLKVYSRGIVKGADYMDLYVVIGGYIIEIIILVLWYYFVIKKELSNKKEINDEIVKNKKEGNNFIKRTVKVVFVHRRILLNMLMGTFDCNEVKKENMQEMKKCIFKLMYAYGRIIIYFICCPLFVSCASTDNVASRVFFTCVAIGIIVKILIEGTQVCIEALKAYIINILFNFEKNSKIYFPVENEIQKIELDKRSKNLIGVFMGLAVLMFFILIRFQSVEWRNETRVIFGVVGAFILVLSSYIGKRKGNKEESKGENGIENDFGCEFFLVEDEIRKMCERLDLSNIKFVVEYKGFDNASATKREDGGYEVTVYAGLLEMFHKITNGCDEKKKNMLLVTVFHELGHIYYKDCDLGCSKRKKSACVVWLLIFMISAFGLLSGIIPPILYVVIIGGELVVGDVMCDIRYWMQIAELKADRLAVTSFEEGKDAFIDFWGREEKVIHETEISKQIDKSNLLYRYYKRYIEEEAHPSIKRRIALIERREKWRWWEYVEHALLIRIWRCSRKGWNGR